MKTVLESSPRPRGSGSLLIHKTTQGASTWYGKWWVGGRQVMRMLGPAVPGGLTREAAERELARRIKESKRVDGSLEMVARRYLAHLERVGRRPSTIDDYHSYVRLHLTPFFGQRALRGITAAHVEDYIEWECKRGTSPKSLLNYLGLLNAIFRYAMRHGIVSKNPVAAVERPKRVRKVDIRFLTLPELERVLRSVPDDDLGATDRLIYLTAALTGLRRGELVALRWGDVDFEAALVRVRRSLTRGRVGPPKTPASLRAVPMAPRLAVELSKHWRTTRFTDRGDLVFPLPTGQGVYDPSRLRKRFIEAAHTAGLFNVRFHDLRHTFGTQAAAAGAPLRSIQAWMGHADYRASTVYVDYAPDPGRATEILERAFGSYPNVLAAAVVPRP